MAQKFLDIFSKRPRKLIKEMPTIIADYREKNSLVIAKLKKLGADTQTRELKVGDYIANATVIERKTISDFLSSIKNKRLINQLLELQQYENRLLVIEGFKQDSLYNKGINENAIRGLLLSIALKFKTPIMFTRDEEETAQFLIILAKKKETTASLNAKKKALTKKEKMQFILEGFEGIGPKTAQKLLKEWGSLKNIFNAPKEKLTKLIGKKAETFSLLEEEFG